MEVGIPCNLKTLSKNTSFTLVSLSEMSPNEISSVTVACGSLLCPICDHDGEDDLYVFFGCIAAQDSWQAACPEMVPHNDEYQPESVADRIFAICNKEDSGTVGRVATLLWCGVFGIIEMNKCGMKTSAPQIRCDYSNMLFP
ncbi:unnamed protein product [Trifolium pratense]|uniref:Uncharacterized protein n=1 Tax=Trifolium pratense TaxID=57577 RepID=A0ACB0KFP2_TRIPR|nr:unnamed protein product [Trifolium pratense]